MHGWLSPFFINTVDRKSSSVMITGEKAPDTQITLGKERRVLLKTMEDSNIQTVHIKCKLKAIPLVAYAVTAQIHLGHLSRSIIQIYHDVLTKKIRTQVPPQFLLSGVSFECLGLSYLSKPLALYTMDGLLLVPNEIFYTHLFKQQDSGHIAVTYQEDHESGHMYVSPPGLLGGYPLWSYGGILGEGEEIHLSEPLFFSLRSEDEQTQIDFLRASSLKEQGMVSGRLTYSDREIVLVDPNESLDSVLDVIVNGGVTLKTEEGNLFASTYLERESHNVFTLTLVGKGEGFDKSLSDEFEL